MRGIEDVFPLPQKGVRRTKFVLTIALIHVLLFILSDGGPAESMTYLTGYRKGNLAIPTSAITPTMRRRSVCYVESDPASTHRVMRFLSKTGHSLMAQVHMHPGCGPGAVQPSDLDLMTHRNLIKCYNMIDIILSRDGYFHIFREKPDWEVEFYGKGVKKVGRNIWKLENAGPIL